MLWQEREGKQGLCGHIKEPRGIKPGIGEMIKERALGQRKIRFNEGKPDQHVTACKEQEPHGEKPRGFKLPKRKYDIQQQIGKIKHRDKRYGIDSIAKHQ